MGEEVGIPRIVVDPGQLGSGAGEIEGTSSLLAQAAGQAGAAANSASGAAGDSAVAGAVDGWGQVLADALSRLSLASATTASNLASAADAYTTTDAGVIPAAR